MLPPVSSSWLEKFILINVFSCVLAATKILCNCAKNQVLLRHVSSNMLPFFCTIEFMRPKTLTLVLTVLAFGIHAQRQLDIQGNSNSTDTVATINVNYSGAAEVVGLAVRSTPSTTKGKAGYFFGGDLGIHGHSNFGTGVYGQSNTNFGIHALSQSGSGIFSESTSGYGLHGFSIYKDGIYGNSVYQNGIFGLSSSLAGVYGLSPTHVGVRGQSDSGIGVQGLSITGKGVRGESTRIGILGTSITDSLLTIFVDGRIGVVGYSDDTIGVYGVAIEENGRGVKGEALGEIGTGVIGIAMDSIGIGVAGKGSSFDFLADGPGIDFYSYSSQRWKKDIRNIPQPLEMIKALRGVYFNWDARHGARADIGMIAEEVGEIIPEIVAFEDNGKVATGLDYSRLTPLLIEGIKSLIQRMEALEAITSELKSENEALKSTLIERKGSILK